MALLVSLVIAVVAVLAFLVWRALRDERTWKEFLLRDRKAHQASLFDSLEDFESRRNDLDEQ